MNQFTLIIDSIYMKFMFLTKGDFEVAVNKDAVAYVSKSGDGTRLFLRSVDKEGKLIHFCVKEAYDDVVAMLNAE